MEREAKCAKITKQSFYEQPRRNEIKNRDTNDTKSIANWSAFVYDTQCVQEKSRGELAEWSKAHDWKSCLRETVTRVQIPNSPPKKSTQTGALFDWILLCRSI